MYPRAGFTKAQVIDYYVRIAPVLLPHLKDRPLTLKRYPEGVDHEFFYEKQCPELSARLGEDGESANDQEGGEFLFGEQFVDVGVGGESGGSGNAHVVVARAGC